MIIWKPGLKSRLGIEAEGNKTEEIILRLRNEEYIFLVLFPQASEPSMVYPIDAVEGK